MIEKTLVLVKPDGVQRGLVGKVISRFEDAGLKIIGMKMKWVDDDFAKRHYTEEDIAKRHGEKVWRKMLQYIREGPVVAFVLEGVEAIEVVRKIVGVTYPKEAAPGTIRGDFCHISKAHAVKHNKHVYNIIHASANKKDAKNEVYLWFNEDELHTYKTANESLTV